MVTYTFNNKTYPTEYELRQHLTETNEDGEVLTLSVPEVSGDPETFWKKYNVVYTVEEDPVPVRLKALEDGVQLFMDTVARARGYDSIYTAIGYNSSTVKRFREDAEAANAWRDAVWVKCHKLLDSYMAGTLKELTLEQVIARLPTIKWSETEEY